jgi:hypothetical protein
MHKFAHEPLFHHFAGRQGTKGNLVEFECIEKFRRHLHQHLCQQVDLGLYLWEIHGPEGDGPVEFLLFVYVALSYRMLISWCEPFSIYPVLKLAVSARVTMKVKKNHV